MFGDFLKIKNSTSLCEKRSNVDLMTSRRTKRNEKVKFREKLFCSIHERPTIGDCFPAAAAFSALSAVNELF